MQKFTLLLLGLVLLAPLGVDLYLPTLPEIALGLNTPVNKIQTTIPLFLLVIGLGQLLAGPLVDKLGRKPVALAGLVLYLLGSILAASAADRNFYWHASSKGRQFAVLPSWRSAGFVTDWMAMRQQKPTVFLMVH